MDAHFLRSKYMQTNSNPVLDSYQHQMETSREVAGVVFDVVDRMEHMALENAHKVFDERMRFYQSLSAVRAPQDVLAFQAEFFSHAPERMLKAQQDWMQVFAESQKKISEAVQHYKDGMNGNGASHPLASRSDDATQPNGALTNMFSIWDKAFKETVAMATGGVASALSAAQNGNGVSDVAHAPVKRKNARAK
jgi:Phasin protein